MKFKKCVFTFVAAVVFWGITAHGNSDPSSWYAPKTGWKGGDAGVYTVYDWEGNSLSYEVGADGVSIELETYIYELQMYEQYALSTAYEAMYAALKAQVMVQNMANNLDALLTTTGFEITGSDGRSYTITFPSSLKDVINGGDAYTRIKAKSTAPQIRGDRTHITTRYSENGDKIIKLSGSFGNGVYGITQSGFKEIRGIPGDSQVKVDDVSIATNTQGTLELKDWPMLGVGVLGKWYDYDEGKDVLVSQRLDATNGITFVEEGKTIYKFGLQGWNDGQCQAPLSDMLSNPDGENAQTHLLLAKKTNSDRLHYVPIGNGIIGGGGGGGAALKFRGTDYTEVVVGSGSTTNLVEFASDAYSNVRVTCEPSGNGVKITFGVYYR